MAVRRVYADEFREDHVKFQAEAFEAFAQYLIGSLRLFIRIGP